MRQEPTHQLPLDSALSAPELRRGGHQPVLLGTAVLLVPYHHPVIVANRLATVDVLAKGRMRLLTVGLGSLPGQAGTRAAPEYTRRDRWT